VRPPVLPRTVKAGQSTAFALDLAPPTGGWKKEGKLRVQGETALGEGRWRARLNGTELAPTDDVSESYPNPYPPMLGQPEELRAWRVPVKVLRDGLNELELTMESGKTVKVGFIDLALA